MLVGGTVFVPYRMFDDEVAREFTGAPFVHDRLSTVYRLQVVVLRGAVERLPADAPRRLADTYLDRPGTAAS